MRGMVLLALVACSSSSSRPVERDEPPPAPPLADAAASVPAAPALMVAVGSVIATVDASGVKVLTDDIGGPFAWLDRRTLVVASRGNDNVAVERFVYGKRTDVIIVPFSEWKPRPEHVVGRDLGLLLTAGGEIWLTDDDSWLRVQPAPRLQNKQPPVDGEPHRTGHATDPWPLPPESAAPAGYTVRVTAARRGSGHANEVTCTGPQGGSSFPPPPRKPTATPDREWPTDWDDGEGWTFDAGAIQWVSQNPALYSVSARLTNPAGEGGHLKRFYFRACQADPLDGYAWLGGQLWASYEEKWSFDSEDVWEEAGTWTFHDGDKPIGTLSERGWLRANNLP